MPLPSAAQHEAARRILDSVAAHYQAVQDYRRASLEEFPHLDDRWYARTTAYFTAQGFHALADLENLTISRAPHTALHPTCLRALVSADGTVTVGLYDPRIKGLVPRLLLWVLGKTPKPCIDCETECRDGSFVATSNAEMAATIELPPTITARWMRKGTAPADVYATHQALVAAHLAARPGVVPLVHRSVDDVLASQHRQNALKAAFRGEIPGLTDRELEQLWLIGPRDVAALRTALTTEQARRNHPPSD